MPAQEVISSTGDFNRTSDGSVSWTIGEPISNTIAGSEGMATQGFHQPNEIIPTLGEWGIVICGLLLIIIGVTAIQNMPEWQSEPIYKKE